MSIKMSNTSQPTILLPCLGPNVDAKCISHELRNIGCIAHVVVTKCISMTGSLYNRASVYFKYWYENESTKWPRKFLLEGSSITLTGDSCSWRAQAFIEDKRPYRERRLDDELCDADVQQGFIDRRTKRIDYMSLPISRIAAALPPDELPDEEENKEEVLVVKPEKTKPAPIARDPEMVARMRHAFRCEITDEIYRDNLQMIRDEMEFAKEECADEEADNMSRILYGGNYPVMKRRPKIIC